MRIISQNRDISVEFDNVILKICNGSLIYAYPYANQAEVIVLGKYESQERAREVFEDIHNAYAPVGIITTNLTEDQTKPFIGSANLNMHVIAMDKPDTGITTYNEIVYYMPEN